MSTSWCRTCFPTDTENVAGRWQDTLARPLPVAVTIATSLTWNINGLPVVNDNHTKTWLLKQFLWKFYQWLPDFEDRSVLIFNVHKITLQTSNQISYVHFCRLTKWQFLEGYLASYWSLTSWWARSGEKAVGARYRHNNQEHSSRYKLYIIYDFNLFYCTLSLHIPLIVINK